MIPPVRVGGPRSPFLTTSDYAPRPLAAEGRAEAHRRRHRARMATRDRAARSHHRHHSAARVRSCAARRRPPITPRSTGSRSTTSWPSPQASWCRSWCELESTRVYQSAWRGKLLLAKLLVEARLYTDVPSRNEKVVGSISTGASPPLGAFATPAGDSRGVTSRPGRDVAAVDSAIPEGQAFACDQTQDLRGRCGRLRGRGRGRLDPRWTEGGVLPHRGHGSRRAVDLPGDSIPADPEDLDQAAHHRHHPRTLCCWSRSSVVGSWCPTPRCHGRCPSRGWLSSPPCPSSSLSWCERHSVDRKPLSAQPPNTTTAPTTQPQAETTGRRRGRAAQADAIGPRPATERRGIRPKPGGAPMVLRGHPEELDVRRAWTSPYDWPRQVWRTHASSSTADAAESEG